MRHAGGRRGPPLQKLLRRSRKQPHLPREPPRQWLQRHAQACCWAPLRRRQSLRRRQPPRPCTAPLRRPLRVSLEQHPLPVSSEQDSLPVSSEQRSPLQKEQREQVFAPPEAGWLVPAISLHLPSRAFSVFKSCRFRVSSPSAPCRPLCVFSLRINRYGPLHRSPAADHERRSVSKGRSLNLSPAPSLSA
ncbi:MAG: hypothetical protein DMF49_12135 [Acidobacteria bacterium]|nr:MAG: hypothetical protein DMF49_12135 [Acidobacteriota bacterium]